MQRSRTAASALGAVLFMVLWLAGTGTASATVNANAPGAPVKLIFIHHSTGEAWLADNHGALGVALRDNRYFVSDTNYGWGDDLALSRELPIGSTTDIGDWYTWFRGGEATAYTTALYAEGGQNCSYSRLATDPGGENEIVVFKSCFPNSNLIGDASAGVPDIGVNPLKGQAAGGDDFTVANAKGIYLDLLNYFAAHQEKLFVAIVAPPIQSPTTPADGRAMANWMVNDWLNGYPHHNVAVFDYYDVLTSAGADGSSDVALVSGNHHRIWNGAVQHKTDGGVNYLKYPSGDDHPNTAGDLKATSEFVPLLNNAYNTWKGLSGDDTVGPKTRATRWASVRKGRSVALYYRVTDDKSASATVWIRIKTRRGVLKKTLVLGLKGTGPERHVRFTCRLARGSYRYFVNARDLTGNPAQLPVGHNTLIVK
jgi:hypothetical protein